LRLRREGVALVKAELPQPQQVNMGGAETGCRPTPTSEGEAKLHSESEGAIRGNPGKRPKDFPAMRRLSVSSVCSCSLPERSLTLTANGGTTSDLRNRIANYRRGAPAAAVDCVGAHGLGEVHSNPTNAARTGPGRLGTDCDSPAKAVGGAAPGRPRGLGAQNR